MSAAELGGPPTAEPALNGGSDGPCGETAIHKRPHADRHYRRAALEDDGSGAGGAGAGGTPGQAGQAAGAAQQLENGNHGKADVGQENLNKRSSEAKSDSGAAARGRSSRSRSSSRGRGASRGHRAGSASSGSRSRSRSGGSQRRRHSSKHKERGRSCSRSRSRGHGSSQERRQPRSCSRSRAGHNRSRSREGSYKSSRRRHSSSRSRSRSRRRHHHHHKSRKHSKRDTHDHGSHHHHSHNHDHDHSHQQRKRSRSRSRSLSLPAPLPRHQQERQQQPAGRKQAAGSQQRGQHLPAGPAAAATAAAAGRRDEGKEGEQLLRRDSGGAAASLDSLSLRQGSAPLPSPGAAMAAAALVPPPATAAASTAAAMGRATAAAAAAAAGAGAGPSRSPAGLPALLPVRTPTAAALAAQGIDIAEVSMVQPSPMAAEATVAALAALKQQPARPPHLPHPAHAGGRAGHAAAAGGAAGGAAAGMKQLLSFGDELEEEEEDAAGPGASGGGKGRPAAGGMAAATAKRFKHEKTLVMLNPLLRDLHTVPYEDDESLPVSPAAPLDKRLGQVMWGSAQAKGMRPYMEDRHTIIPSFQPRTSTGQTVQDGVFRAYAAVFDGHNGASAADHAADRLHHVLSAETAMRTCTGEGPPAAVLQEEERVAAALVHSFESVDREIMTRCRVEGTKGGATGLVVLRIGNQLYAAHCGDTRAVMSRNSEALRLTEDHKPNLPRERKRVEAIGGRVDYARCWRVIVEPGDGRPASGLAVSRSFGDPDFKEPLHLVTATPDVIRERLLPGDEFVILASDGLWDVLSDSEACTVVRRHLQQAGAPRQITPPQLLPGAAAFGGLSFADQMRRPAVLTPALAAAAAERLVQESLDRGTMDNVTAVVGLLQWD